MAINKHNYEAYFIDHIDGNLSRRDEAMLMAFLDANPDLKAELEDFISEPLTADPSITYNNKGALKMNSISDVPTEKDKLLIAHLEGDHDESEQARVAVLIAKDTELAAAFSNFEKSIIVADPSIVHPDKSSLKKKAGLAILPWWTTYAAAAMLIILLGLTIYFQFIGSSHETIQQQTFTRLEAIGIRQIEMPERNYVLEEKTFSSTVVQTNYREEFSLMHLNSKTAISIAPAVSNPQSYAMLEPRNIPAPAIIENTPNNEDLALADAPKQKTAVGRVISGFFNKIKPNAPGKDAGGTNTESRSFSLWDVADLGMRGVNVLGDHDYTLIREYNEKGNVKGVSILEE
jgi:hypothetical protein